MHSCRLGLIIPLKQKNNLDETVSCYFLCWLWSWLSQVCNVPSWFIAGKNVIMSFPVNSRQSLEQWQEIPLWSLVFCSIVKFPIFFFFRWILVRIFFNIHILFFDCHLSHTDYMKINYSLFSSLCIINVTNSNKRDIPHIGHTQSVHSEKIWMLVMRK